MRTDEAEFLARLWLREPTADVVERAVREMGFPGALPDELAQAYADLFLLNVFPYGSTFTDFEGELNGASARLAARAFEQMDFAPAELGEVAGADHMGLCLAALSHIDRDPSVAKGVLSWLDDFLSWGPVCCLAVQCEPPAVSHPFYRKLAERTLAGLMEFGGDHLAHRGARPVNGAEDRLEQRSEDEDTGAPAPEFDGDDTRLNDILSLLLAPARSGLFISRARLGQTAKDMGLRLPFGTRYEVARALFVAAGEGDAPGAGKPGSLDTLLRLLSDEVANWRHRLQGTVAKNPEWAPVGAPWIVRCAATLEFVEDLRRAAAAGRQPE